MGEKKKISTIKGSLATSEEGTSSPMIENISKFQRQTSCGLARDLEEREYSELGAKANLC